MEKYYEIEQISATGTGYVQNIFLVKDPVIENGAIKAFKVGVPDWDNVSKEERKTQSTVGHYSYCSPAEVIIIGNATCTEVFNPVITGNPAGLVIDALL